MSDVTTVNAGQANPESDKRNRQNFIVAVLAGFIVTPFAILSGLLTWIAFSSWKYRRSTIAMALGIYMIPFTISWFFINWFSLIISSIGEMLTGQGGIVTYLLAQLVLGIPIGVLGGLAYCSYRWRIRPEWVEVEFKPSPLETMKRAKVANEIRQDLNTPFNGFTLGVNATGERIIQTDEAAAMHTLVVGASGSGKTTTMMSKLRDAMKREQAIVFIDLKGGTDIPLALSKFAKRYNRKFSHWLIQARDVEYKGPDPLGPAYYDPLARGDATRRTDMIIASREWSEIFYKQESQNYLQMLFNVIIGVPREGVSTLSDVVSLLNPRALLNRAKPILDNPIYTDIISGIEALNDERISQPKRNAIEGLRSQLEVLLNSSAGQWLLVDPNGHNINLKEVAHKGEVVVFSLDSSQYPELSSLVANLIIQDLKTVSSELREDPSPQPMQIFIDEFSAIGSENIIGFINKSRDAKLPVTLATQALGDLRKINEAFLDQLIGIISSFIIHRANKEDDAKEYAGLTGKVMVKKFVQNVEHQSGRWDKLGRGSGTGGGRVEEVEQPRVLPQEIQELEMGHMIYISKAPTLEIERVICIPEEMVEEVIPDDEGYQPYISPSYSNPLPVPSTKVETYVEDEPEPIRFTDEDEPVIVPDIPAGGRMSDPDKLKSILNKNADVDVSMPKLPVRPVRPQTNTASEEEKSKEDVSNITGDSTLIKPKPGLPSIPKQDKRDEFEF